MRFQVLCALGFLFSITVWGAVDSAQLGRPSEGHQVLTRLVGKWTQKVKFWASHSAKPTESVSAVVNRMILDGRFLEHRVTGKAGGKSFQGLGIYGFDNVKQEYQGVWIEKFTTGMMLSHGTFDPTTKTLSETGESSDSYSGLKSVPFRGEWKFIDDRNYTYSTFIKDEKGAEYRNLEITYQRK